MGYITTRMPAGFPGEVTRTHGAILEPGAVGAADLPHGAPVKLADGKLVALAAGDDASDLYGFIARSYPSQGNATPNAAPAGSVADVLRAGYMAVTLATGAAGKGGAVHVRVSDASGAIGDIQATAVAEETVAINATFMGAADAAGVVEIAYNI